MSKRNKYDTKIDRKPLNGKIITDLGPKELENHHVLRVEYVDGDGKVTNATKGNKRVRNLTQTALDYCLYRKLITFEQFLAGDRFYRDCYYAGYSPHATCPAYDGTPQNKGTPKRYDFYDGSVEAERRYSYIHKALSKRFVDRPRGITFFEAAQKICIDGLLIAELEEWSGWPKRSGKKILSLVLDDLDTLYGELWEIENKS